MLAMSEEDTLIVASEKPLKQPNVSDLAELEQEAENTILEPKESEATEKISSELNEVAQSNGELETSSPPRLHQQQPQSQPQNDSFKSDDPQVIKEQLKYCQTILKGLKRHRDGTPFLVPVDPVALGIPDYPKVITSPMDLGTVTKKLESGQYTSAVEFSADVRLILSNCFTFNAPDSQVSKMGRNLEKYLNNCLLKMPSNMEQVQALASSHSSPARRKSDTLPMATRPKREATTPTGRSSGTTLSAYSAPPSATSHKGKRSAGDITFCRGVLNELTKKTHQTINWPFLQPVDPVALGIPDYFNIIKHPMDLTTIRHKLDSKEYVSTEQFEADVRLIFTNCYTYNSPDTDIVQMAKALEAVFEAKWAQKPVRTPPANRFTHDSADNYEDEYDQDEEKILMISQQISSLQSELTQLLMRRKGSKGSRPSSHIPSHPASHSSQQNTVSQTQSKKKPQQSSEEELTRPMTFEEKKQLSEDVNNLPPERLTKIVEIIHDSMPNLRENADSDVIELDVESLDIRTLRKLQRYVKECTKKRKAPKAAQPAKKPQPAPIPQSNTNEVPFPVESSDESSDESGDE